jgi:hypothetical protein
MVFICKICEKCPSSHSLVKYEETEDRIIYYTSPSESTNNETSGIIYHYDGVLGELNGKKWIWILDLKDFSIKSIMEVGNGIALAKLITEKYSATLQNIIVINTNVYTNTILNIITPFLSERVRNMIVFPDKSISKDQMV